MKTAKEEIREILTEIPDDLSYDEILYFLYSREKIHQGLRQIDEGRTVDHEDARKRFKKWLEE